MTPVDYSIVGLYLVFLLGMGLVLRKRASSSSEEYFLGARKMPWWALGASGMSSNLDVAGTMTIVTLLYLLGLHGFFVEFRGGVVLPLAVFLAFMGKWHRRSGVMTTAEWMELRFGKDRGGRAARIVTALTYLVITIGMVVFFLAAAGKFLSELLPFSPVQCQILLLLVASIYTAMSGVYGVVWTDVFQSILILAAVAYVGWAACMAWSPELLSSWPGAQFNSFVPRFASEDLDLSDSALGADYSFFGLLLAGWMLKGIVEGLGGSGGSAYMAQRFYAARSDRDCQKIAMLWTLLFAARWPLVLGLVILAAASGINLEDPEKILPQILLTFPQGFAGLVLAALLAAAMSTFDSTINAGASYVVKDVYEPLRKGRASDKECVRVGYIASVAIVLTGFLLALQVESVVGIWVMIVIHLFPAFLVPFTLRWFWWRLNGAGFAAGIVAGFVVSLAGLWGWLPSSGNELATLALTSGVSGVISIFVSMITAPVPEKTLGTFCAKIKPWGWWPGGLGAHGRKERPRDLLRLLVAIVWQITTFLLPMGAMLRLWDQVVPALLLWLPCTAWLLWDLKNSSKSESRPTHPQGQTLKTRAL